MGLRLSGGTGRVVLQGDALQLQQLSFQTGRNGTLTANGSLRLDEQQGIAVDLAVASRRSLAGQPRRPGGDRVERPQGDGLDSGRHRHRRAGHDRSCRDLRRRRADRRRFPLSTYVRSTSRRATPAPPPAAAARPPQPPSATPIRLALDVQAPQAVFVRGRGLDAEMSGSLKVTGAPTAPAVLGGLTVRRGDFTLGGRRLVFSRGIVSLNNVDRIDPALDFIATTSVQSTTINVAITGTAARPPSPSHRCRRCPRTKRWRCCCSASRPRG